MEDRIKGVFTLFRHRSCTFNTGALVKLRLKSFIKLLHFEQYGGLVHLSVMEQRCLVSTAVLIDGWNEKRFLTRTLPMG